MYHDHVDTLLSLFTDHQCIYMIMVHCCLCLQIIFVIYMIM